MTFQELIEKADVLDTSYRAMMEMKARGEEMTVLRTSELDPVHRANNQLLPNQQETNQQNVNQQLGANNQSEYKLYPEIHSST